jgi:hypothetical protein
MIVSHVYVRAGGRTIILLYKNPQIEVARSCSDRLSMRNPMIMRFVRNKIRASDQFPGNLKSNWLVVLRGRKRNIESGRETRTAECRNWIGLMILTGCFEVLVILLFLSRRENILLHDYGAIV